MLINEIKNGFKQLHADPWRSLKWCFYGIVLLLLAITGYIGYRISLSNRSIPQFGELERVQGEYVRHWYKPGARRWPGEWIITIKEGDEERNYQVIDTSTERFEQNEAVFVGLIAEDAKLSIYYSDEELPCRCGNILQLEIGETIFLNYQDSVTELMEQKEDYRHLHWFVIMGFTVFLLIFAILPLIKGVSGILYKIGVIKGYAQEWVYNDGNGYYILYVPREARKFDRAAVLYVNGNIQSQYRGRIEDIYVKEGQAIVAGDVLFLIKIKGCCIPIASVSDGTVKFVNVHRGDYIMEMETIISIENMV